MPKGTASRVPIKCLIAPTSWKRLACGSKQFLASVLSAPLIFDPSLLDGMAAAEGDVGFNFVLRGSRLFGWEVSSFSGSCRDA